MPSLHPISTTVERSGRRKRAVTSPRIVEGAAQRADRRGEIEVIREELRRVDDIGELQRIAARAEENPQAAAGLAGELVRLDESAGEGDFAEIDDAFEVAATAERAVIAECRAGHAVQTTRRPPSGLALP